MVALTVKQKRSEDARLLVEHQQTLSVLLDLVESDERKDMLGHIKIPLGSNEKLWLTAQGLLVEYTTSGRGIDGDPEERETSYKLRPSLDVVKEYGLRARDLRAVLAQLRA